MVQFMRHFAAKWGFGILTFAIIGGLAITPALTSAADGPRIEAISPLPNQTVPNVLTLRYNLLNADPSDYISFWSVDNGQWNRMGVDASNPSISLQNITVGTWNWQKSNTYTLQFIELHKRTGDVIKQEVKFRVGMNQTTTSFSSSNDLLGALGLGVEAKYTPLYADPLSEIVRLSRDWSATHPDDKESLEYLSSQPLASWYGDWNKDVKADVNTYVTNAVAAKSLPVVVAYNIPGRDCGSYSAGGASTSNSYLTWMRNFTDGIGNKPALVLLEPDAIPGMDCLNAADKVDRLSLISDSVDMLKANKNTRVYIDAGNPKWHSVDKMASRLKSANIEKADGFSLNISNFFTTTDNIDYGTKLSQKIENKHFVIDTSRNGNGPTSDYQWCNPAGRALGIAPSTNTGNKLVDAYLWVKGPGGSDGTCGPARENTPAPSAGAWWPQYAKELLVNSSRR